MPNLRTGLYTSSRSKILRAIATRGMSNIGRDWFGMMMARIADEL